MEAPGTGGLQLPCRFVHLRQRHPNNGKRNLMVLILPNDQRTPQAWAPELPKEPVDSAVTATERKPK